MAFDSAFNCNFIDCLTPCVITFVVSILIMVVFHIFLYFKFVKLAKIRFGDKPLVGGGRRIRTT